jgi:hypothetical protein
VPRNGSLYTSLCLWKYNAASAFSDREDAAMDSDEVNTLTTYEVASDGTGARLNFVDANGRSRSLLVPVDILHFH